MGDVAAFRGGQDQHRRFGAHSGFDEQVLSAIDLIPVPARLCRLALAREDRGQVLVRHRHVRVELQGQAGMMLGGLALASHQIDRRQAGVGFLQGRVDGQGLLQAGGGLLGFVEFDIGVAQVQLHGGAKGVDLGRPLQRSHRLLGPAQLVQGGADQKPGLARLRRQGQGRVGGGQSLHGPAGLQQGQGQAVLRAQRLRIERRRRLIGLDRRGGVAGREQRRGERQAGRRRIRDAGAGVAAGLDGSLEVALFAQGAGQLHQGAGVVRGQVQRSTIPFDGGGVGALPVAQIGQGDMGLGVVRAHGDQALEQLGGRIRVAAFEIEQAIEIEGGRLGRLSLQHLAVKAFRLVAASRLVMVERQGDGFESRAHSSLGQAVVATVAGADC